MYTVEQDFDASVITVIDDAGQIDDVKVYFTDDVVYITQFESYEDADILNNITLSYDMLKQLYLAYHSPEGAYQIRDAR